MVAPLLMVSSSGWAWTSSSRWSGVSGMPPNLASGPDVSDRRLGRPVVAPRPGRELDHRGGRLVDLDLQPPVVALHQQLERDPGCVGDDGPRVVLVVVLAREPLPL